VKAGTRRAAGVAALFALAAACVGVAYGADVRKGEQLYGTHCASCHGADGAPAMPGAPDLRRGTALMRSDQLLLDAIRRGRGGMPAYFGILKDREILDVIVFMRTLAARGIGSGRRRRRRPV
jgi:cytochrome c6